MVAMLVFLVCCHSILNILAEEQDDACIKFQRNELGSAALRVRCVREGL